MRSLVGAVMFGFLCGILSVSSAYAAGTDYSDAAFQAAVKSGKPVALVFHATWCPTCKAQEKSLTSVLKDPALSELQLFTADFDSTESLQKTYKVTTQGTILLFRDGKEIDRSVGETTEPALKSFLMKATGKKK